MDNKWLNTLWTETYNFVTDMAIWINAGKVILKILLIIILARILARLATISVNRIFKKRDKIKVDQRRIETMRSLLENLTSYVIYFIAILLVLSELDFQLAPMLASAGVVGLAIGFGAQNLVQDVITGFFIIFEDQYAVGDYVTIGSYTGTVHEFGLRITKIKSYTGEMNIIPNGAITQVTNYSVQNSLALLNVHVGYEEDLDKVNQVLGKALKRARLEIEEIIADPEILGVQELKFPDVVIGVAAECRPMEHFSANRKMRAIIKQTFDEEGIAMPYPKLVTLSSTDKHGQGDV